VGDPKFIPAGPAANVPDGDLIGVTVAGREIVLYNLGGEIFASEAFCTHGHAQLAGGYVEGDKVQCPMHGGMFDIRTGKVAGDPCTVDLKMFPVKIEGGAVLVALPSDQ
jgi:naphthalene 1,2-dioxygenase system ferredoxin subunit